MRAVVYSQAQQFDVIDVDEPALRAGEVRLRILASGVCGTDGHIHDGGFGVRFPVTPGHEMVGEVIELGARAAGLAVNDRVVVDNVIVCGACDQCAQGRPGLCRNLQAYGLTHQGSAAETIVVPAAKCVQVGDLDPRIAVLAEPLACVVHGMDLLQLPVGGSVLIVGAGPTGQLLSQLTARSGAGHVVVVAPTEFKLKVALQNGATHVVQTDRQDFTASLPRFRELEPLGFDVVIDATGSTAVLSHLLELVRDGGTLMVYGMADEQASVSVSPYEIFRRELTIKGSFSQTNCVGRAVSLLRSGRVQADGIVTHVFPLDEYANALEALSDPGCLKAIVVPAFDGEQN
jgi:D-arabinitol dehydrogenase (NADP+)